MWILYVGTVGDKFQGMVQNVVAIVVKFFLAERNVTVGYHTTQSGQTVGNGFIDDYAYHRNGGCELTVGELYVCKLFTGLAMVGALGLTAHNVAAIIAFDGSGQEG